MSMGIFALSYAAPRGCVTKVNRSELKSYLSVTGVFSTVCRRIFTQQHNNPYSVTQDPLTQQHNNPYSVTQDPLTQRHNNPYSVTQDPLTQRHNNPYSGHNIVFLSKDADRWPCRSFTTSTVV